MTRSFETWAAAGRLLVPAAALSYPARRAGALCCALAILLAGPAARAASYAVSATPFNWVPTAGHTVISSWDATVGCPDATGDDSESVALNIGFTFRFAGTNYTQLRVLVNGMVEFGNTYCYYGTLAVGPPRTYPNPIANANDNNLLRIYAADLYNVGAGTGTITYASLGSAPNRSFVVSWNGVPQWSAAQTSYNLQIQLLENGQIYFMYGVSNDLQGGTPVGPAQIGLQVLVTDDVIVQNGLPANNSGFLFETTKPSLVISKSSAVLSDPINNTTNPKRIPGSQEAYSVTVKNAGAGTVDASSLVITDPIPKNTSLYVTAPVVSFTDGAPASGLTLPAGAVTYSNQVGGGAPYTYTPVPNGQGYDPNVTGIRIAPTGTMNAAAGGSQPSFTVTFKVQVN
jgi:uncharacterized repeat protein (TIGR01451 family)